MPKKLASVRGFVILIVLAVIAVITAVVAGQLLTSQKAAVTGFRTMEDAEARAIAEACLDQLTQYAVDAIPLTPPVTGVPAPNADYDILLAGANGNSPANFDSDDFLPFGVAANTIHIPPVATDQLHAYELIDVRPGSGGLCAARFDDNSDDGKPPLPATSSSTVCEGAGVGNDVRNCDRDLSVYLTVVGLFPANLGSAGTAYNNAHAHVTLRRLIQQPERQQSARSAVSAPNVSFGKNAELCGSGGIEAKSISTNKNDCVCGTTDATSCTGKGCPPFSKSCPGCPSCDPPINSVGDPTPILTNIDIHWDLALTNFPSGEILGAPPRAFTGVPPTPQIGQLAPTTYPSGSFPATDNISNNQFCGLWAAPDPLATTANELRIYVWDRQDPSAFTTLGGAPSFVGGIAPVGSLDNCTAPAPTPTDPPSPCDWPPNATGLINCTSATQSACWKLIARMVPGTPGAPVGIAGGPTPGVGGWNEGTGGDDEFHPRKNVAIPNVAGGKMFGTGTAATTLCGDPNGCQNCSTAAAGASGTNNFFRMHTDHWHFQEGGTNDLGPVPVMLFAQKWASSSRTVHYNQTGDNPTGSLRISVQTDDTITIDDGQSVCCATCNCTGVGPPPGKFDLSGAANCDPKTSQFTSTNGIGLNEIGQNKGVTDYSPPGGSTTPNNLAETGGTALKAKGIITLGNATMIGDVRGGGVDIQGTPCVVGSIVGLDPTVNICSDTNCPAANVCEGNNGVFTGDIHSMNSVVLKNNPIIDGDVVAAVGVCMKNNPTINGTVTAGTAVDIQNNATINPTSRGATAAATQANPALQSFMEASW
jgi:hypothetical protein